MRKLVLNIWVSMYKQVFFNNFNNAILQPNESSADEFGL